MSSSTCQDSSKDDELEIYVSHAKNLHEKMSKISANNRDILQSMERIKNALYTIGQAHRR